MASRLFRGLPVLAIGLLVCHLIRVHVLEWYLVPSSSMEPVLHGDPETGDIVLVDKTAFWRDSPAPFEMVVVRHDSDEGRGQMVKRLIATGDDERTVVQIRDGDVFTGRTRQDLRRVVKHPSDVPELRLTHFRFPGTADLGPDRYFHETEGWRVRDGRIELDAGGEDLESLTRGIRELCESGRDPQAGPYLAGHLSTSAPIDTSFLDPAGQRWGSANYQRDIGIEIECLAPGAEGVQLVLEVQGAFLVFQVAADGTAMLFQDGVAVMPRFGVRRRLDQPVRIAFGILDSRLFCEVGGLVVYYGSKPIEWPEPSAEGPPNLVHVAAAGGPVDILRIELFHDVFYKAVQAPFDPVSAPVALQPGELYLLGDNTFDSRDSRSGRTFHRTDLVGRPLAILAPAGRRRWLTP